VEYAMARKALLSEVDTMADWVHGALGRLGDDKLVGIRLRWVLSEQDWDAVEDQSVFMLDTWENKRTCAACKQRKEAVS